MQSAITPSLGLMLVLFWCSSAEPGEPSPSPPKDNESLGKAAILGCAANIRSFPFYTCRYRFTTAQAATLKDAIQGQFINAVSFDSRLIVDGEKAMYESLAPPVEPDSKKAVEVAGKKGVMMVPASPIESDRYLADGKSEMNYCPQLSNLGLWAGDQQHRGISPTPLGRILLGEFGQAGPDLKLSQPETYEITYEGMQEVDGRPLVTINCRRRISRDVFRYSFDVGRGYLPVRLGLFLGGSWKQQRFVDVRECSNQRWFPERCLAVTTPDKGDLLEVDELKLLEFDADHRPDPSEFAIAVPAGTTVNHQSDTTNRYLAFNLKQDEKIHIEDFPKLFDMLDHSKSTPLMDTAIPHPSPYLSVRWVGSTIGLLVALGGLLFLVRRRLRRQTA
jgi:hypothetical protein